MEKFNEGKFVNCLLKIIRLNIRYKEVWRKTTIMRKNSQNKKKN